MYRYIIVKEDVLVISSFIVIHYVIKEVCEL